MPEKLEQVDAVAGYVEFLHDFKARIQQAQARASLDLRRESAEMKGFSPRNLKYMRAFAEAYLNERVDDLLRHEADAPTIGLLLCRERNHFVAEYALRDIRKPISVSAYELTRALPENLRNQLPAIEDIEAEISENFEV